MENELLAECVEDMIDYVVKMVYLIRDKTTYTNDAKLEDLETMPENIKYGCNQRISGFLLQEGVEDFSPFKGGKQRILKTLKALCKDIMYELNEEWTGYVVIGLNFVMRGPKNLLLPNLKTNLKEY